MCSLALPSAPKIKRDHMTCVSCVPAGPAGTGGHHGACQGAPVGVTNSRCFIRDIASPLRGSIAFDTHSSQRSSALLDKASRALSPLAQRFIDCVRELAKRLAEHRT